jgi:hypothetical protein
VNAVPPQQRRVTERRDDRSIDLSQRRDVHVVVMVMTDEHEIDRRQIVEANPRRPMPPRPGE